ncbi:MAG: hypothetical protein ACYCQK_05695 [Acidiferrobacteraceae bacterium]
MKDPRAGLGRAGAREVGVTLIELLIFIVVISIAVTGVLLAFAATERGGPTAAEISTAQQLAQERLELILAQRPVLGFDCFNTPLFDPCQAASPAPPCPGRPAPTSAVCTSFPPGFAVNTSLTTPAASQKLVRVQVTGPGGQTLAQLTSEIDDY